MSTKIRDKFLPVGSVLLLKGGTKKVMVTGFCSIAAENQDKIYDYCGCIYPEGYLNSNEICLFDHEQISEICFLGYENEEEKEFKSSLAEVVKDFEDSNIDDKIDFFNDNFKDDGDGAYEMDEEDSGNTENDGIENLDHL